MNTLLIISTFWVVSEIILSRLKRARVSDNHFDKSSLKILWSTITVSVATGIILKNTNFAVTSKYITIIYYSGITLICLGLIIRWIAILKLKKSFTVNVSVSQNQEIVQSGIYKYIRHPAYSGSLLSFFGLGIVFNNFLTLTIIFIPTLFSFIYRIHIEEKLLTQVFGTEYTNYCQNTWKLIPKVY